VYNALLEELCALNDLYSEEEQRHYLAGLKSSATTLWENYQNWQVSVSYDQPQT
jgi:hypothetical protein